MATVDEGIIDNFWLIDFDEPISVKISIETEDENGKKDTRKTEKDSYSQNTHNINQITLGMKSKHSLTTKTKKNKIGKKYKSSKTNSSLEKKNRRNKCKKGLESNNITKLGVDQMVSIVSQVSPEENELASKADQPKEKKSIDSDETIFEMDISESNEDHITSFDITRNHKSLTARNSSYIFSNKCSEIEPNTTKSKSLETINNRNEIKDQNEVKRQPDNHDINKSQCESTQSYFFCGNEGLENDSINKFKCPRIKTTPHRHIQRYRGKMDAMKSRCEKDEDNHKSKNKNISIVQTNTGAVNHDLNVENENPKNVQEEMTFKPLLEVVAKNFMIIFPALNAYQKERKLLQNETRVCALKTSINNLKHYCFSLSYSTICCCLLPHKNNQNFLNMFYDLCEDIARKENIVHFNRHVLKLLCIEMIDWTFKKQMEIEKFLKKVNKQTILTEKTVKPQSQMPNSNPITPICEPNEYDVSLKRPSQNLLTPQSSQKADHVRLLYVDKDGKKVELTINPNSNAVMSMDSIHYYNTTNNNLRNDTIPDNIPRSQVNITYRPPLNTQTTPNIIDQQFSQTIPTIANELRFQNTQGVPNTGPLQNLHRIADSVLYQKIPSNFLSYRRQRESSEEANRYLPYPNSYSSNVHIPPPPSYISTGSMNTENYFHYQKNSNQQNQEPTIWNNAEESNRLIQDRSSISRDSSFMSPYSDSIKSKEPDPQENDVLPTIRFVTSMNPSARLANYRKCRVCGSSTNLLCVGCNKISYCSIDCQHLDWDNHRLLCR